MNQQIRAVAVCRCSTEEESQKEALLQQVREAKQCIQEMGWCLVDTYVEAKSGTTIKGRKEYTRLLEDMVTNKFDIIVIKSIDRLMRNTKDWYLFLDCLQQNQKRLYMYLERKFYTPDDSLITGIKAILAEEYSRELSKKIKNAHKHRQQNGNHFVVTGATYGYKNVNKETVINFEDVPLIKRIFELAADGYGSYVIAKILYNEGYRNRKGEMIAGNVVCKIIRNPIYTGDVILNKKHYDFERKYCVKNPESEWIIRKNVVQPIISHELFEIANAAVDARARMNTRMNVSMNASMHANLHEKKVNNSVEYIRYPFSGVLVCGLCGKAYSRCTRKNNNQTKKEKQVVEWKCSTYLQKGRTSSYSRHKNTRATLHIGGCDNIHLNEAKLYEVLSQLCIEQYNDLDKNKIIKVITKLLREAITTKDYENKENELEKSIEKLKKHKTLLLDKLLNEIITDADYKQKAETIQIQIDSYQLELKKVYYAKKTAQNMEHRFDNIENILRHSIIEKAEVDDLLKCVQKIVVLPDKLQIHIDSLKYMGIEEEADLKSLCLTKEISSKNVRTGAGIQIEEEKSMILQIIQVNPKITIKQIAKQNNWPYSRVRRRIDDLRHEGKLEYSGKNGKGYWIIKYHNQI